MNLSLLQTYFKSQSRNFHTFDKYIGLLCNGLFHNEFFKSSPVVRYMEVGLYVDFRHHCCPYFQVDYENHETFHGGPSGRKQGSPVRIFTNVAPAQINLPDNEGYRYRWGYLGIPYAVGRASCNFNSIHSLQFLRD